MAKIKLSILPLGLGTITNVEGVSGSSCTAVTAVLDKALAEMSRTNNVEHTQEYYEADDKEVLGEIVS